MRLATAPLWMWALGQGVLVTVAGLVIALESGSLSRDRVLVAFGIGVFAGPLLGLAARRGNRRARADLLAGVPELAALDEPDRALAERAARRGPVPDDPEVRAAAIGVARYRLAQSVATRGAGVVFSVLLAATQAWVAIIATPLAWVAVALFAWLAIDAVLAPRRRSARVVALGGNGGPGDARGDRPQEPLSRRALEPVPDGE